MLKILLIIIFSMVYVFQIAKAFRAYIQISSAIFKLSKFIDAYEAKDIKEIEKQWKKILAFYPQIEKQINYPSLSYSDKLSEAHTKATVLRNTLLMEKNRALSKLKHSLNPFALLLNISSFPSKMISLIGITLNSFFKVFVDAISWIILTLIKYLVDQHLEEIISFIGSLF